MPKPLSMLLFGLLLILFTPHALADKYHGEFCWQVFSDSNETLWKYKFGIYEKEGGHFTLYGSIDYGPNGLSASHGNAIFIGDTIKLGQMEIVYGDEFARGLNFLWQRFDCD